MMRRAVNALFVVALLLPAASLASQYQRGYGHAPAPAHDLSEPAAVLRQGVETLTGYLDNNPQRRAGELQAYLEQEIVPYFDFERMAQWAAGSTGRYLNPPQQAMLTQGLKKRFLTAMAEQLSGYSKSRIKYLRPKGSPERGEVTLGVQVYREQGYPVQIDFKLYLGRDGWKVYDVVANGASAVAHYRGEFQRLARRHGVPEFLSYLAK